VTVDGNETAGVIERVCQTMSVTAQNGVPHAVVFLPAETSSDGPLLRIVEQLHHASPDAQVVLHPPMAARPGEDDVRWAQWLERAMATHADVRVMPRWPVPSSPAGEAARGTRNTRAG
jgi:hypothetical protein